MKKALLMGFAIVVALLVTNPAYSEEYRAISGRVIAEDTGEGLAGIMVAAFATGDASRGIKDVPSYAVTDDKGFYVIKDLTAGDYLLSFYNDDDSYVDEFEAMKVTLPQGENLVNVNRVLTLGASVSGKVFVEVAEGFTRPIKGAGFVAESNGFREVGVTDQTGRFLAKGMPESNNCKITIDVPGFADLVRTVKLEKGKLTEVAGFVFTHEDETGVHGILTSSTGEVYDVLIVLQNVQLRKTIASARTEKNGEFTIVGVSPGRYRIAAISPGRILKKEVVIEEGKSTEVNFAD